MVAGGLRENEDDGCVFMWSVPVRDMYMDMPLQLLQQLLRNQGAICVDNSMSLCRMFTVHSGLVSCGGGSGATCGQCYGAHACVNIHTICVEHASCRRSLVVNTQARPCFDGYSASVSNDENISSHGIRMGTMTAQLLVFLLQMIPQFLPSSEY